VTGHGFVEQDLNKYEKKALDKMKRARACPHVRTPTRCSRIHAFDEQNKGVREKRKFNY